MKGLTAALARLHALPLRSGEALGKACRDTARQIAFDAWAAAPVRTGFLRSSVIAEASGLTARVTARASYAAAVEWGGLRRAPRPFLLPAVRKARFADSAAQALRGVMP